MTKLEKFLIQKEAGTLNAKLYFGKNAKDTNSGNSIPFDLFITNIQEGEYQDIVLKVRLTKNTAEKTEIKKRLPLVCISGNGSQRTDKGITEHSGFIGIDADNVDPVITKKKLRNDPFVFAVFVSCGGHGVCIIFKIDGKKHSESFEGIAAYLYEKYKIVVDPTCKNISRARFVSWDPDLILNERALIFRNYPKRETKAAKTERCKSAIAVKSDIEQIIKTIEEQKIDTVPTYEKWLNVGFAFANEFGENGREYFHRISSIGDYNQEGCEKQYTACLKSDQQNNFKEYRTTINYFFKLCKPHGLAIESQETATIKKFAYSQFKAGVLSETIISNLEKFEGFTEEQTRGIVEQICQKTDYVNEDSTDIECIIEYLKNNFSLRLNEITGLLENDGKELSNRDIHTIELSIKEKFPKTDYTTIGKILDSNFIEKFHPILEFFEKNKDRHSNGSIDKFFSCIKTTTGTPFCEDTEDGAGGEDYAVYFGKKWLVGMIANLFENVSPLMLVLCGNRQGTGKTYFFQHLLPNELQKYCTIKNLSSLGSDTFKRDMDIAISRYWLIYDDEMAGKSKRDHGAIKALLSTDGTNVRAAYARSEEYRKRIAAFGGTTNDLQILADYTGNRRFIPVEVDSINQEEKDMIDPVDYIMEAYHLFQNSFDYKLSTKDIELLNKCTQQFTQISTEFEMVVRYYQAPTYKTKHTAVYRTGTDIKNKLEGLTKEKMNPNKLAAALKAVGVEGSRKKYNGVVASWYLVIEIETNFTEEFREPEEAIFPTTLPF